MWECENRNESLEQNRRPPPILVCDRRCCRLLYYHCYFFGLFKSRGRAHHHILSAQSNTGARRHDLELCPELSSRGGNRWDDKSQRSPRGAAASFSRSLFQLRIVGRGRGVGVGGISFSFFFFSSSRLRRHGSKHEQV